MSKLSKIFTLSIRKKIVTDQKITNIVRKFEDDDITNDLEVVRMLPRPIDSFMLEKKINVEDDKLAVRKKEKKKTPKENIKMRKLKEEEEEEITGSQDDRYPEVRNIQGIPCTGLGNFSQLEAMIDLDRGI